MLAAIVSDLAASWPLFAAVALGSAALFGVGRALFAGHVLEGFDYKKLWQSVLNPLMVNLREKRTISRAESDDLKRQILALDKRVRALLYRDECYFAYMRYDAEWHQRHELRAAASGWTDAEPHISFLSFRDKWMRDHKREREPEIWL